MRNLCHVLCYNTPTQIKGAAVSTISFPLPKFGLTEEPLVRLQISQSSWGIGCINHPCLCFPTVLWHMRLLISSLKDFELFLNGDETVVVGFHVSPCSTELLEVLADNTATNGAPWWPRYHEDYVFQTTCFEVRSLLLLYRIFNEKYSHSADTQQCLWHNRCHAVSTKDSDIRGAGYHPSHVPYFPVCPCAIDNGG